MSVQSISLQTLLTMPENLYWAWEKFKAFKAKSHFWFDEGEVAYFEANIKVEFSAIASQFKKLKYKLSPLKPMPFPTAESVKGISPSATSYWISVRDQVAWLAFINIIGPWADSAMPVWSYGNRLYRATWMEEKNDPPRIKTGYYRHASGSTYRKPDQVWPLYRRHIFLTTKAMTGNISIDTLEPNEFRLFEAEASLPSHYKLPYLNKGYWPETESHIIFWASVDFERFTEKINSRHLADNLAESSPRFHKEIAQLAKQLLDFRVYSDKNKKNSDGTIRLKNTIPKALAVAGFLENIALLKIDKAVSELIFPDHSNATHEIAHFRYNEENVILGKTFEALESWIKKYSDIIKNNAPGLCLDSKSTKPEAFSDYLLCPKKNKTRPSLREKAFSATLIDPVFPLPDITRPVEIINEMTKTKFDILLDSEKDKYITNLENLLHNKFHATPAGNEIRINFAAGNLARFTPELVIGSHAGICNTERKINKNQTKLKNMKEKNRVLVTDSDEKKVSDKHIHEIQNEILFLNNKKKSILEKNKKKSDRIRKRGFFTLLKALYDYPGHLPLWYRIFEYCKLSGHNNLTPVHEALILFHQADPHSAGHVRAFVAEIMAIQILECLKEIADRSQRAQKRDNAFDHLVSLIKAPVSYPPGAGDSFYEKSSKMAYECSVATVMLYFSKPDPIASHYMEQLPSLIDCCKKNTGLNWEKNPVAWAEKTGLPLHAWIWWAETKLVSNLSVKPGEVWKETASLITPDSPLTWAIWSKYPREIHRYNDFEFLKKKSYGTKSFYKKRNTGRLYDILRDSNLFPGKEFSKPVNQVLKSTGKGSFNLDIWVEWLNTHFGKNTFDPRLSEWTALEIIDQIICILLKKELTAYPVHPANFIVPRQWTKAFALTLSWERWRGIIRKKPDTIKLRLKNLIIDSRYNHHVSANNSDADKEWGCVRGLCLLLYGLLTRSFRLPAAWNTPGHKSAGIPLVRSGMAKFHFSSFTTAIIEGGLGPRQRETTILKHCLQLKHDRDTDLDPPLLTNLVQLQAFIRKSRERLEKNQMTIHRQIPKQLVPVNLKHFTRPEWQDHFIPGNYFPVKTKKELRPFLRLGFIQTTTLASSAWKNNPEMTRAESDHAWKQIQEGFHILSDSRSKPNIIILPELAVPGFYRENLLSLSKKTGALVIAGMDYTTDYNTQSVKNQAIVIVPRRWPETRQSRRCSTFNFGKTHMAPGERGYIIDSGLEFDSEQTVWIFDTGEFGKIGVCICYDFMDVERYLVYKGKIHHLIVLAYNRDIDSFYHLADSLSKTLFCNVIICNTGYYGGSVAVSPYYEPYNRTLYRQEGKNLFSVQVVKLPVSSIDRARKGENVTYSDENGNLKRLFKSLPPGCSNDYE